MKRSEFANKIVGTYFLQSGKYEVPLDLAYRLIEEFEKWGMLPPSIKLIDGKNPRGCFDYDYVLKQKEHMWEMEDEWQ